MQSTAGSFLGVCRLRRVLRVNNWDRSELDVSVPALFSPWLKMMVRMIKLRVPVIQWNESSPFWPSVIQMALMDHEFWSCKVDVEPCSEMSYGDEIGRRLYGRIQSLTEGRTNNSSI